ncbi:hypothetical protein DFH09DRAFT_1303203 [Mycena vulgaris]|nr:hypothetical protein DFH09DRAFT_1303203 [Mycena vulgaris]
MFDFAPLVAHAVAAEGINQDDCEDDDCSDKDEHNTVDEQWPRALSVDPWDEINDINPLPSSQMPTHNLRDVVASTETPHTGPHRQRPTKPQCQLKKDAAVADTTEPHNAPANVIPPLTELLARIPEGTLPAEDMAQLNRFRGALATSHKHLLALTVLMAQQHETLSHTHDKVIDLRNLAASRLASLHNEVTSGQSKINQCLTDNIKILREMGASDAALREVISLLDRSDRTWTEIRDLLTLNPICPQAMAAPEDIQSDMNGVISPQGATKSDADFEQRILSVIRWYSGCGGTITMKPR